MRAVTLITGASAGIGTALAHVFAQHGYELLLIARREQRLAELADAIAAQGHKRGPMPSSALVMRSRASTWSLSSWSTTPALGFWAPLPRSISASSSP
jgi:NAD(P)-dependent dehydrogenase (short-subunit alcohol dehydrogenase family)